MLPGMSGVNFAKSLRKDERTLKIPIIMLTARSEEADKLRSFEAGIDDYVTKPFSPKELIARIKALLRRTSSPEDESLVFAGIRLELNSHKAFVNEDRVALGPTEFKLLLLFMRNPDRVFDRSQLVDEVWGRSVVVEERTVDVHILRLRKVLKPWGRDHVIETVRGVGYRLAS
jgi:two-component system phosphate regulon response regulator PhoB